MLDFVRSLFRMGQKHFRTTWDLVRHGANLRVRCRCGHVATIAGAEIDHMRSARHWPKPIGYLADKLRCSRCGRRPIALDPTANDPTVKIGPSLADIMAANSARDET